MIKQLFRYIINILDGRQAKTPVIAPSVMRKLRKGKKLTRRQQEKFVEYKNYISRYDDERN